MSSKNIGAITATALTIAMGTSDAAESRKNISLKDMDTPFVSSVVIHSKERAMTLCSAYPKEYTDLCAHLKLGEQSQELVKKLEYIKKPKQVEISRDGGKTWMTLDRALLLAGGILGLAGLAVGGLMIRNLRKPTEKDNSTGRKVDLDLSEKPKSSHLDYMLGIKKISSLPKATPITSINPTKAKPVDARKTIVRPESTPNQDHYNKRLEERLKELDANKQKTIAVFGETCEKLQKFIDTLPQKPWKYMDKINGKYFFGSLGMIIIIQKMSVTEYNIELTLTGINGTHATGKEFRSLNEFKSFFLEKVEEEYEHRKILALNQREKNKES